MRKIFITVMLIMSGTLLNGQDGKLSGLVFYEFSHELDNTDAVNNEFEMQRVYLTFDKELSPTLSYQFQTDVARNQVLDRWLDVYLKKAKVDWTIPLGTFTLGLQGMNVFNVQEKTWGHRYLEKSTMDRNKFCSSTGMGIGYARSLGEKLYIVAMVTNGTGFKAPEDDVYKKVSAQLVWGERNLSSRNGFNIGGVMSYEPMEEADGSTGNTSVIGLLGGWATERLRAGAEFDLQTVSEEADDIQIMSGYVTYGFNTKLAALIRLDQLTEGAEAATYGIIGVSIIPEKGLRITPNVRYLKAGDQEAVITLKANLEFKI